MDVLEIGKAMGNPCTVGGSEGCLEEGAVNIESGCELSAMPGVGVSLRVHPPPETRSPGRTSWSSGLVIQRQCPSGSRLVPTSP